MSDSENSRDKKFDTIASIRRHDDSNKSYGASRRNVKKNKTLNSCRSSKVSLIGDSDRVNYHLLSTGFFSYILLPLRFVCRIFFGLSDLVKGVLSSGEIRDKDYAKVSARDGIAVENQEFRNNLENFVTKTAEDIMIPRSDIFAVSYDCSLEKLCEIISKNNHTRTLVYKENLDNIIGFIHIKDLFKVVTQQKKYNFSTVLRKHIVCPCSMKLINLFKQMQDQRVHIAIVVDEYGGTDGLVTIEDVIEEIVGRIDDEYDHELENDSFKIIKPGVIIANARLPIEEMETVLKCRLKDQEDEFDTIGGLVIAKSGNIPTKGDIIEVNDKISIEVIEATPRTIKQLKITF